MAFPCSSGGKVSRRIAWDTGISTPPPMPWITRKTTMEVRSQAMPQSMELMVKLTMLKR